MHNVKGHLINSTAQVDEGLHPYVSLMEALESIFSCKNYESCLLTVECNTVAIFKTSNTIYSGLTQANIRGIPQMHSLSFR